MRTADEMRKFSERYTIVGGLLLGANLNKCVFEKIESALKEDEDVLFCAGTKLNIVFALTNQRMIVASRRDVLNNIPESINYYSYDNVNSVHAESYMLTIKIIGEKDLAYGNFRKETIAEAVAKMEEIINAHKSKGEATQVIQQAASAADGLKKFKDLLDSGVITQKEFDAKKKQLLGL